MGIKSELKHNALIYHTVDDLLKSGYTTEQIFMFTEYNENGIAGEIDLYAVNDRYTLLFEMKCTYNSKTYKKSVKQLNRAKYYHFKTHLYPQERMFKFMVHYDKHKEHGYDYKWVRE